jgi:hypothetical protein
MVETPDHYSSSSAVGPAILREDLDLTMGADDEKPTTHDRDANELQQFGYRQQLRRTLGSFSSFAVAFSLISVFTGVFANFGHGLRQVGGALVWSWLLVLAGQMLVALVLAELSTRFPLSGYGY